MIKSDKNNYEYKEHPRKWLAITGKVVGRDGWGFEDWIYKKYNELQRFVVKWMK